MKIYSQNENNHSIAAGTTYGPNFGIGNDILIRDNCNSNNESFSNFPTSYGINENAKKYELTKSNQFTVKRY